VEGTPIGRLKRTNPIDVCPAIFDKPGIEEEIVYHLKTMEKDLIRKGALPSTLSMEPLPQIAV
jgi:hypothetical protein